MPGNDRDGQWQWIWEVDNHGHAWEQTGEYFGLQIGSWQNAEPVGDLIPPRWNMDLYTEEYR